MSASAGADGGALIATSANYLQAGGRLQGYGKLRRL